MHVPTGTKIVLFESIIICMQESRMFILLNEYTLYNGICNGCWLPMKTRQWDPIAEDTSRFGFRTSRKQARTQRDVSTPSSHSARCCCTGSWGRTVIQSLPQLWSLHTTLLVDQVRSTPWCNCDKSLGGATNPLIGFEAPSMRGNPYLIS